MLLYCFRVFNSRRIQMRPQEDIPFKVLAANNEPDFCTISGSRDTHRGAGEFERVLGGMEDKRREAKPSQTRL